MADAPDVYAPPQASGPIVVTPDDVTVLALTTKVRVAAGAALMTGLFALALAIQTFMFFRHDPILVGCVLLMLIVAGALVAAAALLRRMRGAGAVLGLSASVLGLLLDLAWTLISLSAGLVSSLPVILLPLFVIAGLISGLSLGDTRRADAVRARLRSDGLVAGF